MTLAHKLRSGKGSAGGSSKKWVVLAVALVVLVAAFLVGRYAGHLLVEGRGSKRSSHGKRPSFAVSATFNKTGESNRLSSDGLKAEARVAEERVKAEKPPESALGKGSGSGLDAEKRKAFSEHEASIKVKAVPEKESVVKTAEVSRDISVSHGTLQDKAKGGSLSAGPTVVVRESGQTLKKIDYLEEATRAFKAGDYAKAIELYDRVLRADPGNKKALLNLATIYYQVGEKQKARELFIRLLKKDTRNPYVLNNLGVICMDEGDYSSAIYYFDRALKIDPTFKAALINKVLCLKKMGRIKEAMDLCAYGIKLFPREYRFYLYMGIYLYENGDTDAAYRFLSRAYQLIDDKNSSVALMLRRLLER